MPKALKINQMKEAEIGLIWKFNRYNIDLQRQGTPKKYKF